MGKVSCSATIIQSAHQHGPICVEVLFAAKSKWISTNIRIPSHITHLNITFFCTDANVAPGINCSNPNLKNNLSQPVLMPRISVFSWAPVAPNEAVCVCFRQAEEMTTRNVLSKARNSHTFTQTETRIYVTLETTCIVTVTSWSSPSRGFFCHRYLPKLVPKTTDVLVRGSRSMLYRASEGKS